MIDGSIDQISTIRGRAPGLSSRGCCHRLTVAARRVRAGHRHRSAVPVRAGKIRQSLRGSCGRPAADLEASLRFVLFGGWPLQRWDRPASRAAALLRPVRAGTGEDGLWSGACGLVPVP